MLYNKKYTVNPSDIVDGVIRWKSTGSGEYIIGEYRGEKYFIKRYTMGPRIPPKTLPEPAYSEALFISKWIENKQSEMRKLMSGLSVKKDHIVVEEDNFWDSDGLFVTITKMIPGENFDFDYATLDFSKFLNLCKDITLLIKKIHTAGVTHGDLKIKNILIQNEKGELIPYLIDFDSSYPSNYGTRKRPNGKPMLAYPVVFSEGYQSPEIAIFNHEDEGVIDAATITDKTDVFTLAIIFHKLWTGSFPAVIGDPCAVGEAIYTDQKIQLDPKFDVELGPKNKSKFSSLLFWMLSKESAKRPTAAQVLDALNDDLDVSDVFDGAEGGSKFDLEPHNVHKAALIIYDKDKLKAAGVTAFLKIFDGGQYKYYVKTKDGKEAKLSVDDVVLHGYGEVKSSTMYSLFDEDAAIIELEPNDVLMGMGVLSIEPVAAKFKKFYSISLLSGYSFTTSKSGLVDRNYAKYKVIVKDKVDMDVPWPEHGSAYDESNLQSRNVNKVEKVVEDGVNKYKLVYSSGKEVIVKAPFMKLMGFIK